LNQAKAFPEFSESKELATMRFSKLMLAFGTLALGIASAAATYHMTISDPAWVGQKQLKPGEYKVQLQGTQAVIKGDGDTVQVPVQTKTAQEKYPQTAILSHQVNGKRQLEEVQFGGSKTSILFQSGTTGAGSD
jgi:hypothetical protein